MAARRSLDSNAFGLMVLFCLILGLQQVAIKAAAQDIAPIMQIALRSGIGAALLGLYMYTQRESLVFSGGSWKPGLVVGVLFTVEYYFLGEALRFTSASHAVVFLYTAPIFAGLLLHFLVPSERMVLLQWVGILLAFTGVAVTFLVRPENQHDAHSVRGDLLALLAGLAWGATTVLIRTSRLADISAKQTLLYQLVGAFAILLLLAFVFEQATITPTPLAIASLGFQAVIVSFAGFLVWFWLLRHYLASQLGALSFMTPLFGVGFGAWLLNEPVEPGFLLGSCLVILGIVLVTGHKWVKRAIIARRDIG